MKRIIFVLAVLALISYSRPPSFQSGSDTSVVWASPPKHILHSANNVPRSVNVVITFTKKFPVRPRVALGTFLLDWQNEAPSGYHYKLSLVNRKSKGIYFENIPFEQNSSLEFQLLDPNPSIQSFSIGQLSMTQELESNSSKRDKLVLLMLVKITDKKNSLFLSEEKHSQKLPLSVCSLMVSNLPDQTISCS